MKLLCVFFSCAIGIAYCGVEPRVVAYGAHITHPWWGKSSVWRTQIHPHAYEVHEGYDSYHDGHEHDYHASHPSHHGEHDHYEGDAEEPAYEYHNHHDHHQEY